MINVNQLEKGYKKGDLVLKGVSVSFEKGKINGIIGSNGAGKTTLFNCIYGIINNYKGDISLENSQEVRYYTGYVPAEHYFYPKTTGKEYLEFCAKARKIESPQIREWNKLFELPLNNYAESYSTGMKRKLALLGALISNYEILILDEPFNGLDLSTNMLLKNVLVRLKENGKTLIISSHALGLLTDISDKIYFLNNGSIEKTFDKDGFHNIENDLTETILKNKSHLIDSLTSSHQK